jgi:S-adenosylmethionine hydrolase
MSPIVTLTTDFGHGTYVAQIKGVILGYCRQAVLIDVTHDIPPQDIPQAALALADSAPSFPAGTLHLVVVDPGVGSQRPILYAEIGEWQVIAPDNGLLTLLASRFPVRRLVRLTEPAFWGSSIAPTFHGRDIMAHVIGNLLQGVDPLRLGQATDRWIRWEWPAVEKRLDGLAGRIIHFDHFGNAITNIGRQDLCGLSPAGRLEPGVMEIVVEGVATPIAWSPHYAGRPAGSLVALLDSQDRLEIAVVNGNARAELGLDLGLSVVCRPERSGWPQAGSVRGKVP